jgi:hypothetical protein
MAALNEDASRVLVSHGASADGFLLNDTWILDLNVGSEFQVCCKASVVIIFRFSFIK